MRPWRQPTDVPSAVGPALQPVRRWRCDSGSAPGRRGGGDRSAVTGDPRSLVFGVVPSPVRRYAADIHWPAASRQPAGRQPVATRSADRWASSPGQQPDQWSGGCRTAERLPNGARTVSVGGMAGASSGLVGRRRPAQVGEPAGSISGFRGQSSFADSVADRAQEYRAACPAPVDAVTYVRGGSHGHR